MRVSADGRARGAGGGGYAADIGRREGAKPAPDKT
jgi:hypothetical protein